MPRSLIWKTTLACALAFVAGAGLNNVRLHWAAGEAEFASKTPQPTNFRKPFVPQGKHLSLIQVAVRAQDGIPADDSQDVELTGFIRLDQDMNQDVHFTWELPDGVQAVSGPSEDVLSGMKGGDTAEVKLTVRGFSQDTARLVVLHGYIVENDLQIGNSGVLNSRPEDSFQMLQANSYATGVQTASVAKRPLLDGPIQR